MISSLGSYGGNSAAQWRQQMFSKTDTNSDSSLSKDELLAALQDAPQGKDGEDASTMVEKMFADMDTDQDGNISQSEYSSFQPQFDASTASTLLSAQEEPPERPSAEDMMAETDANGDGVISKDELATVLQKHAQDGQDGPSVDDMFSDMDSDGDGSVSMEELTAFAEKAPSGPPPGGAASVGGTQAAGASSSSSEDEESYDALDTNKDGVVSLSERLAASEQNSTTTGKLASSTLATLLSSVNEVAA